MLYLYKVIYGRETPLARFKFTENISLPEMLCEMGCFVAIYQRFFSEFPFTRSNFCMNVCSFSLVICWFIIDLLAEFNVLLVLFVFQAEERHTEILGQLLYAAKLIATQEGLVDGFRIVINDGPNGCACSFLLYILGIDDIPLSTIPSNCWCFT